MIPEFIIGFAFFVTSIVVHELGHFIVAYRQGLKPKIIFTGKNLFTESLPQPQLDKKESFYISGIVFGFLPLFIGTFIIWQTFIFIPPYIIGCMSDVREIRKLSRHKLYK